MVKQHFRLYDRFRRGYRFDSSRATHLLGIFFFFFLSGGGVLIRLGIFVYTDLISKLAITLFSMLIFLIFKIRITREFNVRWADGT